MSRNKSKGPQTFLGIIFCIPIAFIVYFAVSYSSHNMSPDSVSSVTVGLPTGSQYTYSSGQDIEFFVNALLDAKSIKSSLRDISGEAPVTLSYDRGDKVLKYSLYPELNLSGCILVDSDGLMYLLTSDTAQKLLVRPDMQYLYTGSMLPVLSVTTGEIKNPVMPESFSWFYKKVDGNYYEDKTTAVYADSQISTCSIFPGNVNSLAFSVEPDSKSVTLTTQNGDNLKISDLSYLSFSSDTKITVNITAKWNNYEGAAFYGEATYSFPLLYDIPAAVTLDKTNFSSGDFALLNIKHLNEDQSVDIESELSSGTLLCYTDEESGNSYAMMPIPCNTASGDYNVKFKIGSATYDNMLTITQKETDRQLLSVTEQEYRQTLSEEVVADATEKLKSVFSQAGKEVYYTFGKAFNEPVKATVMTSFGQEVLISEDATTRRVIGTVYLVNSGTPVKAAQRGKVVFAENIAATGNTVILDHGYGIMTCYFNLKSFECKVGSIVQQGEKIALSGQTGFTDGKQILDYAVSVNGVFVNPTLFSKNLQLN